MTGQKTGMKGMTDNPMHDFDVWDSQMAKKEAMLPVCSCCGEPIHQEKAAYYSDQWICEDCEEDFWQDIRSDFMEWVNADD